MIKFKFEIIGALIMIYLFVRWMAMMIEYQDFGFWTISFAIILLLGVPLVYVGIKVVREMYNYVKTH